MLTIKNTTIKVNKNSGGEDVGIIYGAHSLNNPLRLINAMFIMPEWKELELIIMMPRLI